MSRNETNVHSFDRYSPIRSASTVHNRICTVHVKTHHCAKHCTSLVVKIQFYSILNMA